MAENQAKLVAFQVSETEADAIDRLAARNERSRSAEIRMALRAWLAQNGIIINETTPSIQSS